MVFKRVIKGTVNTGSCGGIYIQDDKTALQVDYLPKAWEKLLREDDKIKVTIEKIKE